jgi:hypothetical protein
VPSPCFRKGIYASAGFLSLASIAELRTEGSLNPEALATSLRGDICEIPPRCHHYFELPVGAGTTLSILSRTMEYLPASPAISPEIASAAISTSIV